MNLKPSDNVQNAINTAKPGDVLNLADGEGTVDAGHRNPAGANGP